MWKIPEKISHLNTFSSERSQGHRTLSTMISLRKKINMVTLPRKKGRGIFFISLLNENIWLPCQMRLEAEFLALQKIMLEFYCLTFIWALAQCKKCAWWKSAEKIAPCVNEKKWNFFRNVENWKCESSGRLKDKSFCLSFSLFLSLYNGARTG